MGKCKFNKNDSNLDLQDVLQDTLEEIWEEKDEFSRKAMFINSLKEIGEGYDITSLSTLQILLMHSLWRLLQYCMI